ncbi:MAG: hypothetical protein HQ485_07090 [Acidobacteria bacterium]|jgi:hypothetical protein|nr:hypothetical protein [Acidobacteriota bacterium]
MSPAVVHYLPIVTTALAIPFAVAIGRRFAQHPDRLHLLWWAIGVGAYGAGTLTESLTALLGWHEPVFRLWYITGALLGGAPLAQGTVYLMLKRRTAHVLTAALVAVVAVASVAVWLSPIQYDLVEAHRLGGRVFEWTWVRRFSPFINLYAVIFLVGGAILSAMRYSKHPDTRHRMWGNVWIAAGAILPGIGGAATRFGYTEVLYVMELLGLLMMWRGYVISVRPAPSGASLGSAREHETLGSFAGG